MDFRFQEPETTVEPVIYRVRATLEGQKVSHFVRHQYGRWNIAATENMSYVIAYSDDFDEAVDKAREMGCRAVKAAVLNAEAQRIARG